MTESRNPVDGASVRAAGQRPLGVWALATAVIFFARAFMFSTWVSRGPEVKSLLGIDTLQLGLVTMLYPLGGLLAVGFSGPLVQRFGSRTVAFACYTTGAASLALLGPAITAGSIVAAAILLVAFGAAMAIIDFVGNYEGTFVERAAPRSVFSALHGAFGVGMLAGAAISGVVSGAGVSLATQFIVIGVITFALTAAASLSLPRHAKVVETDEQRAGQRRANLAVWRERRSQTIALIGFSFILAETAAGTWVPIALTKSGFDDATAAYALSALWVAVTIGRLLGGFVVDAIGRFRTVLVSALVTAAGLGVFMLADVVSLPWLGLALWGFGMAIGFPMSVASMSDDPARSAARINMIITIVYLAGITVGPALGAVGQAFGIYVAFAIPLGLMLVSAVLSPATRVSRSDQPQAAG